jgi:TRAP transporter TAXI family solute receptor
MKTTFTGKRLFLVPILTTALVFGLPGCDDDDDETSRTATTRQAGKICTGPTTGTYYSYAGGVIEAAKDTLDIDLENVSTVGSLENAKSIVSGFCDMAIVQADLFLPSPGAEFQASSDFKLFSVNKGSVAAFYPEMIHILVNRDSGINSIADLAGKKVNVGETNSGTFLTAYKMLNVYNQLASQPEYVYEAPSAAVAKVVEGSLDATFYVAGAPISTLLNLPADANVTLIPATTTAFNVEYATSDIPATTYPWLHSDILNSLAVWSVLTVGPSVDRSKLGPFLETLYANKDSYADKYHAKWARFDKANTIANIKSSPGNGWNREVFHYFAGVELPTTEPLLYFCSASTTGTYTKVVQDLIPVVYSTLGISLTEKNTAGSLENLMKMYSGECAMALMQHDITAYIIAVDQANPTISTESLAFSHGRIISTLYPEDVHLVVNTNSGIESSRDLAGKKFNLGENGSGTLITANAVLLVNNIKIEEVIASYEASSVALPKVISGEYDAMLVIGKVPVSYLAEADCPTETSVPGCVAGNPTTLPIKLVPIEAPESLPKITLSAAHYPWQNVDIPESPQIVAMLVVSSSLEVDDTRIADFMEGMYALKTSNTTLSPTWNETTFEQTVNNFNLGPMIFDWVVAQFIVDNVE